MPFNHVRRPVLSLTGLLSSVVIALFCSVWTGSAASAAVVYQSTDVEVRVWSGEADDLRNCINDARDGRVTRALPSCRAISVIDDGIELDGVGVWIRQNKIPMTAYTARDATVSVSGPYVVPFARCVRDAGDGSIDDPSSCSQIAVAGSMVTFVRSTAVVRR